MRVYAKRFKNSSRKQSKRRIQNAYKLNHFLTLSYVSKGNHKFFLVIVET